MDYTISGRCWTCGDLVTVYQIVDEAHWTMNKLDGEAMGEWVFESLEPGAQGKPGEFKRHGYSIVVAGANFGCGCKSVEHPMAALKGAGVRLILAESVSRYSFRNALNLALPIMVCPGITKYIKRDDEISVNLLNGEIQNHTSGDAVHVDGLSELALRVLDAGGILNYVQREVEHHDN